MKMILQRIVMLSLAIVPAATVSATVVEGVTPGRLSEKLETPRQETTLVLSGVIDANDFFFMASEMTDLRSLDLSACSIAACTVDPRAGGVVAYREGFVPDGIFAGSKIENIVLPVTQNVEIGEMAFSGSSLRTLNIGSNVESIGMGAFSCCNQLESVAMTGGSGLASHVFSDCSSLSKVELTGVTKLGDMMFARCVALSEVEGAAEVASIGQGVFAGCTSLSYFDFGTSLREIGDGSFASSGLETVSMRQCDGLKAVGDWAFAHCQSLSTVEFPDGIAEMGKGVLFDCKSLVALALPSSIQTIDDYSLKGLEAMEELTLPSKVSHIGTLAMSGMDNLKSIYAEDVKSVPTLGDDVWDRLDKSNVALKVSADLSDEFEATPQWQDFTIITSTSADMPVVTQRTDASVVGRFEGQTLVVVAENDVLRAVKVYDLSGHCLLSCEPGAEIARVDCGHLVGKVFIVEAYTAEGLHAALKLAKASVNAAH